MSAQTQRQIEVPQSGRNQELFSFFNTIQVNEGRLNNRITPTLTQHVSIVSTITDNYNLYKGKHKTHTCTFFSHSKIKFTCILLRRKDNYFLYKLTWELFS